MQETEINFSNLLRILGYYVGAGIVEPFQELLVKKLVFDAAEKEKYDNKRSRIETLEKNKKIFSKNLIRLRKEKGITQRILSQRTNIPVPSISGYESEKNYPSKQRLNLFAKFFGVPVSKLTKEMKK